MGQARKSNTSKQLDGHGPLSSISCKSAIEDPNPVGDVGGVGDTWTRLLSVITRPVVTRQLASNQPPGPTVREGLGACRLAWTSAPARTAKPLGNPEAHVRPACASRRRSSRHAGGAWAAVKVSKSR